MDVPHNIRTLIVSHHNEGHSGRKIAQMVNLAPETVRNLIRRYRESGSIQASRVGRCGRPRMLSLRDERTLARASTVNPKLTAREFVALWEEQVLQHQYAQSNVSYAVRGETPFDPRRAHHSIRHNRRCDLDGVEPMTGTRIHGER